MDYLARLKQLEGGKISHNTPETDLPKPPKAPFVSFVSTGTGHIEKKFIDAAEARRQKVIAMLEAEPGTQRAICTDDTNDPDNVILTIAVRSCQQTVEMLIPRAKYDPWLLLELIERQGDIEH